MRLKMCGTETSLALQNICNKSQSSNQYWCKGLYCNENIPFTHQHISFRSSHYKSPMLDEWLWKIVEEVIGDVVILSECSANLGGRRPNDNDIPNPNPLPQSFSSSKNVMRLSLLDLVDICLPGSLSKNDNDLSDIGLRRCHLR